MNDAFESRLANPHARRVLVVMLGWAFAAVSPEVGALTYYRAVPVPEFLFPGGFRPVPTLGNGLSNDGTVVGTAGAGAWAFKWSPFGGVSDLGYTPYGHFTSISPDGRHIVSGGFDANGVAMPVVNGVAASSFYDGVKAPGFAYAVNDNGWVLTQSTVNSRSMQLLRPGGPAVDFGAAGFQTVFSHSAVSNSGWVTGTLCDAQCSFGVGMTWSEATGLQTFQGLPGANSHTEARAVNDSGWVVGTTSAGLEGNILSGGFLYNATTANFQFLPGFEEAADISSGGTIVGTLKNGHAGLMQSGSVVDLNAVALGVASDLFLAVGMAINDRGQILVRSAVDPDAPVPATGPTGVFTYLLTECQRCGQIVPNPVPAGQRLDIGADWFQPFNAEVFINEGTLTFQSLSSPFENRPGARLENRGSLQWLAGAPAVNHGDVVNTATGLVRIESPWQNSMLGAIVNRGQMVVQGPDAKLVNEGGWLNEGGTVRLLQGTVTNAGVFRLDSSSLEVGGDSNFVNGPQGIIRTTDAFIGTGPQSTFANLGTMIVGSPGDVIGNEVRMSGTWTNGSSAGATGPDVPLLHTRGTTTVTLSQGTFINAAGRTLIDSGSRWTAAAASEFTVTGGSVDVVNSGLLETTADASFNVLGGGLSVLSGGRLKVDHGAVLGTGRMAVAGPGSRIELSGGVLHNFGGTVDVGPGGEVAGPGTYRQLSGTTMVNGTLDGASNEFFGGVLKGAGKIRGTTTIGSDVTIAAGNSPGTLTIQGETFLRGAVIEIEIADPRRFDRLVIDGPLHIETAPVVDAGANPVGQRATRVVLKPLAGYTPDLNDSFTWLVAANRSGVENLVFDTSALPADWRGIVSGDATGISVWNDAAEAISGPNDAGKTFTVAAGALRYNDGHFRNAGDLVVAGSLANRPGATLQNGEPFVNVAGTVRVLEGGRLSNRGSILSTGCSTLDACLHNAGTLVNYGDGVLTAGAASPSGVAFTNTGRFESAGTMTVSTGDLVNRGRFQVFGSVQMGDGHILHTAFDENNRSLLYDEQGNPRLDASGNTVQPPVFLVASGARMEGAAGYMQNGGFREAVTQVDGVLQAARIDINGGMLQGAGTVQGQVTVNFSLVAPGNGVGTLTLDGDALLLGNEYLFEVADVTHFDRIVVTGRADLQGGKFLISLAPGMAPASTLSFELLGVQGTLVEGSPYTWILDTTDASGGTVVLADSDGFRDASLSGWQVDFAQGRLSVSAVPEPGGLWLLLGGLPLLWVRAARRGRTVSWA